MAWQSQNNYTFNDTKLTKHIKDGANYGIVCGYGNLVVLDFDAQQVQDKIIPQLPKTFTVKTGSGLLHKYFYCDDPASFKILDDQKNTLVDVQGRGKQVIAPDSTHPNGNKYEVVNQSEIASISMSNIKALFGEWLMKKEPTTNKEYENIDKPGLGAVLSSYGIDTSKNPTQCLWHSSKGGKCFSFNESMGVWHCFHCEEKGDVISFVMKNENCSFIEACKKLNIKLKTKTTELKTINIDSNDDEIKTNILELLIDNKRRDATEQLTQLINTKYYIYTIRNDDRSEIWIYDNGIYIPQGKTFIREICRKILGKAYTPQLTNEVISKIEADTYIDSKEFFSNNIKDEIAVKNGILNVVKKKLNPFNPNKIFFNRLPIEYNPDIDCPNIKQFLLSTLSTEDIKIMQEVFGFCLYKDYFMEKAIMLTGEGRNGKSKCIELIKRLLGSENCTNISLDKLSTDQFASAELLNKMANLAGDISSQEITDSSWFKGLTGRDLIGANRKFLPMVYFCNYAKMIFSANQLPITNDNSFAFWERWVLINFPYTFISEQDYNKIPLSKRNKYKIKNPQIIEQITTDKEMSGLLNYALLGLERLLTQKEFNDSQSAQEVQTQWNRRSNSFLSFILDCVEESTTGKIAKSELRKAYSIYCKKHSVAMSGDKLIKKTLFSNLPVNEDRYREDGSQISYWGGIKFKPEYEIIDDLIFSMYKK